MPEGRLTGDQPPHTRPPPATTDAQRGGRGLPLTLPLDSKAPKGLHLGGEPNPPRPPPGARHGSQESCTQGGQRWGCGGGSRGQSPKEQDGRSWRGQRCPCPLLGRGCLPEAGPSGSHRRKEEHRASEGLSHQRGSGRGSLGLGSKNHSGRLSSRRPFSQPFLCPLQRSPGYPPAIPTHIPCPGQRPAHSLPTANCTHRPHPAAPTLAPGRGTLPSSGHCPGCPLTLPDSPGPSAGPAIPPP